MSDIPDTTDPSFAIGRVHIPTRVLMAPMAGLTNGPFRRVAARVGCRAFWTEMIPAEGLVRGHKEILAALPAAHEPHPVAVQLFGAEPSVVADAARMAQEAGADIVDLNLACPVSRLTRIGAGAALMRDPAKVARLVHQVVREVSVPVTVKIRSGWDERALNALKVAQTAQEEGAAGILFHARTRSQGFSGKADHSLAIPLVSCLKIPVVVSGDITAPDRAEAVLRETGAAGLMIGRACLGNPWIFAAMESRLCGGEPPAPPGEEERERTMLEHLDLLVEHYGERRAVTLYRGHLVSYLKGRPGGARWRRELVLEKEPGVLKRRIEELFYGLGSSPVEGL